jgi:hypothetical protein
MQFFVNLPLNKRQLKRLIPWGLALGGLAGGLTRCTGISENQLWDWIDQLQRRFWPGGAINELIIKDPERLERRIRGDVDRAIRKATPEYDRIIEEERRLYRPRYSELPADPDQCWTEDCKALAPGMRMCAPWVDDCEGDVVD